MLRGVQAGCDFDPGRPLFDLGDESLGDLEVDVGFEQRLTHFAQRLRDIFFGQDAFAAQVPKGVLQFFRKCLEHTL